MLPSSSSRTQRFTSSNRLPSSAGRGDVDTHGFAILAKLRASFPHARSLLMDRETLLAHRALWVREEAPQYADVVGLEPAEQALFDDLRADRLGERVRLEQERIGFGWVREALRAIGA